MVQVLKMTTSASDSSLTATMPSATMSPARRSESCSFIWHPKVRMANFLGAGTPISLLNEGRFRIGGVVGHAGAGDHHADHADEVPRMDALTEHDQSDGEGHRRIECEEHAGRRRLQSSQRLKFA